MHTHSIHNSHLRCTKINIYIKNKNKKMSTHRSSISRSISSILGPSVNKILTKNLTELEKNKDYLAFYTTLSSDLKNHLFNKICEKKEPKDARAVFNLAISDLKEAINASDDPQVKKYIAACIIFIYDQFDNSDSVLVKSPIDNNNHFVRKSYTQGRNGDYYLTFIGGPYPLAGEGDLKNYLWACNIFQPIPVATQAEQNTNFSSTSGQATNTEVGEDVPMAEVLQHDDTSDLYYLGIQEEQAASVSASASASASASSSSSSSSHEEAIAVALDFGEQINETLADKMVGDFLGKTMRELEGLDGVNAKDRAIGRRLYKRDLKLILNTLQELHLLEKPSVQLIPSIRQKNILISYIEKLHYYVLKYQGKSESVEEKKEIFNCISIQIKLLEDLVLSQLYHHGQDLREEKINVHDQVTFSDGSKPIKISAQQCLENIKKVVDINKDLHKIIPKDTIAKIDSMIKGEKILPPTTLGQRIRNFSISKKGT